MPLFFQHNLQDNTRLGIWKIEEDDAFFLRKVPLHRDVSHPHKRLQHLAGRYLLPYLFPDFPTDLIRIADTRKPYLPEEQFHFSISHCRDYAAVIVSRDQQVGIDIEVPDGKLLRVKDKFLRPEEWGQLQKKPLTPGDTAAGRLPSLALLWSAKEAVYKWYGRGEVDFRRDIPLSWEEPGTGRLQCLFSKTGQILTVHHNLFRDLVLSWIRNDSPLYL